MSGPATMIDADSLRTICAEARTEVEARKEQIPLDEMLHLATQAEPTRGFAAALMGTSAAGRLALIAEIKKASPSAGLIRPDFDPASLAQAYQAGGATCLSVLTNDKFFQGKSDDLAAARAAVPLPLLRKDFIIDPWQVYESRVIGADCILLILGALSDEQAVELEALARALDLDVVAEVHDRRELDRALGLQTKLIGINNRNLKTLKTNLTTTEELAPLVPPDRFVIAESGLSNVDELRRLVGIGVGGFLVGESLMRQPDVTLATRTLLGLDEPPAA